VIGVETRAAPWKPHEQTGTWEEPTRRRSHAPNPIFPNNAHFSPSRGAVTGLLRRSQQKDA